MKVFLNPGMTEITGKFVLCGFQEDKLLKKMFKANPRVGEFTPNKG